MDVGAVEVHDGMGHHVGVDVGDIDSHETELSHIKSSDAHDENGIGEPHVGMEFDSEDTAKTFYDEYARRVGFSSKAAPHSNSKIIVVREFVCTREGLKRKSTDYCGAMMRIELKRQGKWAVTKFVKEHSHAMVRPSKVHHIRPRRHFAGAVKNTGDNFRVTTVVPSGVMYVSMDGSRANVETNQGSTSSPTVESNRSVKNAGTVNNGNRPCGQKRTLGRDAQNLLDYFKKMQAENPGFFYAIQLDEENRMGNVFWADARSRAAYRHFGDVVSLDTTYRLYKYRVPFAPFTGVNHHGQTILFGCALLLDDSEATFVWLFKTFLTAMNDRPPVSIITDQDRVVRTAIAKVFPEARHCISKWHVLREGQEKLAYVCRAQPNFQVELYNCINMTETIEEFETSWSSILEKYDLGRNDWLQSIYNARAQWVPVYFRDSFFGAISPGQGIDSSFFDGYVNQQTNLPMFFQQYERALENWFEKEIEADFDTTCTSPVLRTPSPMEKQAANLYTRKVFAKFQEELVETFVYTANKIDGDNVIGTFRVAKFEDDRKAYVVTLNYSEMRANCSCQMFEYSGILCRHVLTVFTVSNVLTLPTHYIMRRWTRNAKIGPGLDDHIGEVQVQESLSVRYNNLCREALKYAEEGAIATETYIAAMNTLKEGARKISAVKKNVARVPPPASQVGGVGYDDHRSSSASDMKPLLWPRQDEMTKQFNLNDGSAPAQSMSDLKLPRMGPLSLHRDDGSADNMVVLPCLKSMTWVMENKNSTPDNRIAVINLKLQDYSRTPSAESEVKFQLSRVTLEPMLKSMAYISEQLSTPDNRVAVINLKLQDAETTSGESEVKFQVSRDTLGAMLRSMAYIREQLSNDVETQTEPLVKKQRK